MTPISNHNSRVNPHFPLTVGYLADPVKSGKLSAKRSGISLFFQPVRSTRITSYNIRLYRGDTTLVEELKMDQSRSTIQIDFKDVGLEGEIYRAEVTAVASGAEGIAKDFLSAISECDVIK